MLVASGGLDLAFALFHLAFWRLFDWPDRLLPAGRLNAAITQTLNAMLAFVFGAYGAGLIWQSLGASAGAGSWLLPLAGAAFWTLRFGLQIVWFDLRPVASRAIAAIFALAAVLHAAAAMV